MYRKQNRYKELELYLTGAIIANALLFALYLIIAGTGIVWLKIITAFLSLALAALILYFLYINKEMTRPRSFWITVAAASLFLCTLVSLICNYPAPGIN